VGREAAVDLAESVALLHAVVDRVARDVGARVLFIKGPVLTAQGLRRSHTSVDVDVMVEPGAGSRLLDALDTLGWRVAVEPTSALVLPLHSTTLRHPRWGCELDVHHRFPGFLAGPVEVFEALWERRTTLQIARRDVPCPDVVSHSAVAALHWLRDGWSAVTAERLDYLVKALEPRLDDAARSDLTELVRRTGSAEPLRPFLEMLRIDPPANEHDTTLWRIRTASSGMKSIGWVVELRETPWRRLPGRLWHALVLTEAEIRNEQPNAAPGALGLFRARLRRLNYGLRALPQAVRIVRRERRRR
jgi:putative nucleotidyltransferase-like protein